MSNQGRETLQRLGALLRTDTELQGATTRLVIGGIVSAILGTGVSLGHFALSVQGFLLFAGYFFTLSLGFFVHILLSPTAKPPIRPYLGLVFDISTTTIAVHVSGGVDSPLFLLYVWIFLSNGMRFGQQHMVVAATTAIVLYNALMAYRGEWGPDFLSVLAHTAFLGVFPLYFGALIGALHDARKKAESASQAKSEFLANMTHELRTPLVGVSGLSSLLRMTPLDGEQADYVATLQSSTQVMTRLVDDLLDYSRIEAGCLELDHRPFRPVEALHEVINMVMPSARDKGLSVTCEVSEDFPPVVTGDDLRFRQILLNLVGNAVKFTPHGSVIVRARVKSGADDKLRVRFEVEDTGIGIKPQHFAFVFQRFHQADSSTEKLYQGTGLGTSIAKRLVELMGGEIDFRSEYGTGSCFWFEVPWRRGEEAAAVPPAEARQVSFDSTSRGPILLVEDNPINAKVIGTILRKFGHEVDVAENAGQALKAREDKHYAVIFMDMQLPGIDGPTLARMWRKEETGRPSPIVALTAHATVQDRETCLQAGMTDFLIKPVAPEQLMAIIRKYGDSPQ